MKKAQFDIEDVFAYLFFVAMIIVFFFLFSLTAHNVKSAITDEYNERVTADELLSGYLSIKLNDNIIFPEEIAGKMVMKEWYEGALRANPGLFENRNFGELIAGLVVLKETKERKEEILRIVANDIVAKQPGDARWRLIVEYDDNGRPESLLAQNFQFGTELEKFAIRTIPLPDFKKAEIKFYYEEQNAQ